MLDCLGLEMKEEDLLLKRKELSHKVLEGAIPEKVQEMLKLGIHNSCIRE